MKRRILAYLDYIDNLLEQENVDWEKEIRKHLVQIGFFAHERLVHLIVMALFAIGTIITILYLNYSGEMIILALTVALLVLLVPYIMHYYNHVKIHIWNLLHHIEWQYLNDIGQIHLRIYT